MVAADASQKRGSFMRPVVADFPQDRETWDLAHQFMMGKSILVAPVLDAKYTREDNKPVGEMEGWDKQGSGVRGQGFGAGNDKGGIDWAAERTHRAYLPKGADWWCFATGKKFSGGQKMEFPTTLASQPFFVRAGTVLPLGPDVQFNGEKPWNDIEIRVYPGADGEGELYEDDFETYACEKGAWTRIRFTWNDKTRALTIAARNGEYEGMLKDRAFTVVLSDGATRRVVYAGKEVNIKF
jgi:alpha-D-xyloside xylohydrolase